MKDRKLSKVEILAPAGSYESFLAAVHAGSDAVYLGGSLFSARASAENFSQEQLLKAIDYAHFHGRKVYMAVNTLLKEEELKQLPEYLLPYYRQGLDAVIVQDVGVLELVAGMFPDMAIHLSTQMTLTGSMGAGLFEKELTLYPVTRLVPARELSLAEIRKLRESTNLELEVFVHGALCVSYSGQCFLSSMAGGRSGNRGRCAQPCRKLYAGEGRAYFLSPKDLCTLELIPDLIEAGIDSFKIEGRMKKPEYVAYISWLYRKYADRFLQYGRKEYEAYFRKYPKELEQDLYNMKDLYNRGGCSSGYFFNHNGKNMMSMERPNHAGVLVGKVTAVQGGWLEILWKQDIFPQDVLEIRSNGKKIYEYTAGQGQKKGETGRARFSINTGVKLGMEVFRTRNKELLLWIQENIISYPVKKKLYGEFHAEIGKEVSLTIWEKQEEQTRSKKLENSITVAGPVCQKAKKQPLTVEDVRRQLFKLGGTKFTWEELNIQISDDIFLPVKSLNELRRQALDKFEKYYLQSFFRKNKIETVKTWLPSNHQRKEIEKDVIIDKDAIINKKPKIAAEILTAEQWQAALSLDCVYIIYVRMEILDKKEILLFAEETRKRKKQCLLSLPVILREKDKKAVKDIIELLMQGQKRLCNGFLLHNIEELGFLMELHGIKLLLKTKEIELVADFSMYSTNSMAVDFWHKHGCKRVTASIEQSFSELLSLFSAGEKIWNEELEAELLFYGRLPLMVSAQCIAGYAKKKHCTRKREDLKLLSEDGKDSFHVMNFCRFCYNILYSGKQLCLWNDAKKLLQAPFQVWRCSFVDETKQETEDILSKAEVVINGKTPSDLREGWIGRFHKGMI